MSCGFQPQEKRGKIAFLVSSCTMASFSIRKERRDAYADDYEDDYVLVKVLEYSVVAGI